MHMFKWLDALLLELYFPFLDILDMVWIGKKLLFSSGQDYEGQLPCHFHFQLRQVLMMHICSPLHGYSALLFTMGDRCWLHYSFLIKWSNFIWSVEQKKRELLEFGTREWFYIIFQTRPLTPEPTWTWSMKMHRSPIMCWNSTFY